MSRFNVYALALVGLIDCSVSAANERPTIKGFVSQSLIVTPDNDAFGIQSEVSGDFRELGVNVAWQATDKLRLSGQVLSRKLGDLASGDPELDYLLADYRFAQTADRSVGLMLGRVKTPYGLYNAVRDVPHARPGVFVPQSIYFETFRDPLLSLDGGNLYFKQYTHAGQFEVNLFCGESALDSNGVEYQLFDNNSPGAFNKAILKGFKLDYVPAKLSNLSLSFSTIDVDLALDDVPSLSPQQQFAGAQAIAQDPRRSINFTTAANIDAHLSLFSAQYGVGAWLFSAEYLYVDSRSDVSILGQAVPTVSAISDAYYAQAEWQSTDRLSVYARLEQLVFDRADQDGESFARQTGGNPILRYNEAATLGARFFFTQDFSLTTEFSHNEGAAFLLGPDNVDYAGMQESWNIYMATLSYHF